MVFGFVCQCDVISIPESDNKLSARHARLWWNLDECSGNNLMKHLEGFANWLYDHRFCEGVYSTLHQRPSSSSKGFIDLFLTTKCDRFGSGFCGLQECERDVRRYRFVSVKPPIE